MAALKLIERFEIVLVCRLSHDRANEVVGENVRPDFLAHEFWSFAAQDFHLHGPFQRAEIELIVPATAIQFRQICL